MKPRTSALVLVVFSVLDMFVPFVSFSAVLIVIAMFYKPLGTWLITALSYRKEESK